MRAPYKVGVVGPGGLGLCAIREVVRLPEFELGAVLAFSPEKDGVDAGDLTGIGRTGIRVTTDFAAFNKQNLDVVLYCGRDFGDWRADDQILALLEAGKSVITMLPYHWLSARGADVEARFRTAAEKGRATLFGTGITPGFFNERLAFAATGLTNDVQHIKFQEFFNAEPLAGALETLQILGFGSSKEVAEANPAPAMMAENYLRQPILFAADRLGVKIDRIDRKPQLALTPVDIETPAMTIKAGTVGIVSYAWTAYSAGKPFYTTEVYWFMGDGMRPEGCQGNDFWTIEIEGRPSIRLTVASMASFKDNVYIKPDEPTPPGYVMTIVTMVQAIPGVVAAKPGLMQPALPQFHWKPDQRL